MTSLLAGCVSWFMPPRPATTSTPTAEDVPAELATYYHQVLHWTGCGDGMQCATATAPLDWADPTGDTIELALIRQPATSGHARGSLLVNPGGPGGSGVDFIRDSIDFATSERLQREFDVVGFDPRGVGSSTPVVCTDDDAELAVVQLEVHRVDGQQALAAAGAIVHLQRPQVDEGLAGGRLGARRGAGLRRCHGSFFDGDHGRFCPHWSMR